MRLAIGRRTLERCAAVVLLVELGSCAPHRIETPALTPEHRQALYFAALTQREQRVAAEADLSVWPKWMEDRDLPAFQARLVLVKPDGFRFRIESLFGTALDFSARGDSLTAYVPSRRLGMQMPSVRDSLGVRELGALGYRTWSAAWRPPERAWSAETGADSLMIVRWAEGPDTIKVAVAGNGYPSWASLARPDGGETRVRYNAWATFDGVSWPSRVDLEDARGGVKITCRIHHVRFVSRSDRERLHVRVPADAELLTRSGLKRAIERLGRLE